MFDYLFIKNPDKKPADYDAIGAKIETQVNKTLSKDYDPLSSNLIIGQLYYNQGLDQATESDKVKGTKPEDTKKKADLKAKAVAKYNQAIPHIEKVTSMLEQKGVSLTVHVRAVEPTRRKDVLHTAIDLARPWLDSDELKVLDASEAIELLPNIAWNKGDAVRWIVDDVEAHARQKAWCIFFGDDVTDEDAFRAVRDGLTVVVGQRPSLARLRLNSPADVAAVLLGVTNRNGHGKEYGR